MDIKAGLVKRSRGDPWHLNQTSGKVIGITVIIYVCGEKIQEKKYSFHYYNVRPCCFALSRNPYAIEKMLRWGHANIS